MSIRSAVVVAVAFSEIALGATTSGRQTIELAPRDEYSRQEMSASQQMSSTQQYGAAQGFGGNQQFSASSYSYEAQQIVSQWSSLPAYFSQCHAVFEQRMEVSAAMQAVEKLYSEVQLVSQYSSCSCGASSVQESHTTEFKEIISRVFTSWQRILTIGQENYGAEWETHFRIVFEKFTPFVSIVKGLCVSLQINLSGLLTGLNINLNVFGVIGINLNIILGLGNVVGNVVGAVGGLVDGVTSGLLGGHGLLGNGLLRE